MSAKIVSPFNLSAERLAEIGQHVAKFETLPDEFKLDPIPPGSPVVGTLTDFEREIYVAAANIHIAQQKFKNQLDGEIVERRGRAMKENRSMEDEFKDNMTMIDTPIGPQPTIAYPVEDQERLTRMIFECNMLSNLMAFLIRDRLGKFRVDYTVHEGFKVVEVVKK